MSAPRITYTPRLDATPEAEQDALAEVFRFLLFESDASKRAARPTAPNETKGPNHDRPAQRSLPQ
jgi:hypothetical protein